MKFLFLLGLAALIHCASAVTSPTSGGAPPSLAPQAGATPEEEPEEQKTPSADPGVAPLEVEDPEAKDDEGGLDGGDAEEEFTFIATEGEEVNISKKAALMVGLVKTMIEGDKTAQKFDLGGYETKKSDKVHSGPNISGQTLNEIVKYLKHHKGKVPAEIAKPIKSNIMSKIGLEDAWDAWFINRIGLYGYTSPGRKYDPKNIDQTQCDTSPEGKNAIFDLILAVNYLDIKSLLHLGCAKIATLIKGKTPEEIKKILGEDNDGKPDPKGEDVNNLLVTEGYKKRRRLYQILGLDKLLESSQPDRDL